MPEAAILIILYGAGLLFLIAEIFLPSHAMLTVVGVGFLIAAIVRTFQVAGEGAGLLGILGCLVVLPAFAYAAVKVWPRTPVGKRIAPPNPVLTGEHAGIPVEELSRFIGQAGRALTTLRPVGICDFNGRRVSCVSEFGMIDPQTPVRAVRVLGANVAVVAEGMPKNE